MIRICKAALDVQFKLRSVWAVKIQKKFLYDGHECYLIQVRFQTETNIDLKVLMYN